MNLFFFPPFIISVLLILLGALVFFKNKNLNLNKIFAFLCVNSTIWLFSYSRAYLATDNPEDALFWFKIGYSAVIFITTIVFHYTIEFLRLKKAIFLVYITYLIGFFWNVVLWKTTFLIKGVKLFYWGHYPQAGAWHIFFLVFFISMASFTFMLLLFTFVFKHKSLTPRQVSQIKYLFLAFFIYNFASVDFFPNYGYETYPFGFIPAFLFILIIGYTIIRYRLMDISMVITRTGVFIAVYSLVLGIPFVLAFGFREQLMGSLGDGWWMAPLICSTVLATVGPFIYFYIEKKAEERIFQEQRRYQNTLRQASSGMGRIKDLDRLVNLIVHIVTRTVKLEHCLVYLLDSQEQKYLLKAWRSQDVRFKPENEIDSKSLLIKHLLDFKNPVVYDEIKQKTEDYGDLNLARLETVLRDLHAALVVPSFVEDRLLAIIILGKKELGALYAEDDLNVFSILANQAALAIENAQFYEDMKQTHEQLFKAEKMATIGTMADGLSHQINNRLHALGFIASDVLDTIKMKKDVPMSQELKDVFVDIEHGLTRIQENVTQGGEIVRGLLKYTRKGEEGFAEVDLNQLLDSAIEMTQFKIKSGEMDVLREFGSDIPKIKGNFTQLQEVFFNLLDNAYDAMMQRKGELKEPGYEPTIRISTESNNGHLIIYVHDNGIGIKSDDKNKLFTPFFTTKLSSKKGTGLGLYVIRKLIEENHGGKVVYESKYKEGTKVTLNLPVFNHS